jgi:hypothetical protein
MPQSDFSGGKLTVGIMADTEIDFRAKNIQFNSFENKLTGLDTHITHGLEAWNACRELRDSRTKAEACRAATQLARDSPL